MIFYKYRKHIWLKVSGIWFIPIIEITTLLLFYYHFFVHQQLATGVYQTTPPKLLVIAPFVTDFYLQRILNSQNVNSLPIMCFSYNIDACLANTKCLLVTLKFGEMWSKREMCVVWSWVASTRLRLWLSFPRSSIERKWTFCFSSLEINLIKL